MPVLSALEKLFYYLPSLERIQLLAHHQFQHRPNGALSQTTQMLMRILAVPAAVGKMAPTWKGGSPMWYAFSWIQA